MAERKKNQTTAEQAAQKQETDQVEKTAQEQERDEFADIPNPCVYCGPSVRGVARQYTTYQGGIPKQLKKFVRALPTVSMAAGTVSVKKPTAPSQRFPKNVGTVTVKKFPMAAPAVSIAAGTVSVKKVVTPCTSSSNFCGTVSVKNSCTLPAA